MVQSDKKMHREQWNELTMDQPDRKRTYKRNIQTRSRNHSCCGKATIITYSECVSVAYVIQHEMRMRHIVICGLSGCTKLFYIIL